MIQDIKCPVCNSNSSILLNLGEYNVNICNNCSHTFSVNLTLNEAEIYNPDYFNIEHKNWFENPDLKLFAMIKDTIAKLGYNAESKIFDVGCGNGNFLNFMSKHGYSHLFGMDIIDINPTAFTYIKADINDFKSDEQYDIVISMMNIEHIKDAGNYIVKLKELTTDTGLIIINTIDEHSMIYSMSKLSYRLGIKFPAKRLYSHHHLNHFSVKSLRLLCRLHGLKPIAIFKKNYNFNSIDMKPGVQSVLIFPPILLINTISSILGKQISQTIFLKK